MTDLSSIYSELDVSQVDAATWHQGGQLAFGPYGDAELPAPPKPENAVALAGPDGVSIAAQAQIHAVNSFVTGQALPTAAIASVVVSPTHTGRGLGQHLMRQVLRKAAEQKYVLSTLYPTNTAFYRAVGYEVVAARQKLSVASAHLPRGGSRDTLVTASSVPQEVKDELAEQVNRFIDRHNTQVMLGMETSGGRFAVSAESLAGATAETIVAYRNGDIVGVSTWGRDAGYRKGSVVRVNRFAASDDVAARSLLCALGAYSSVVEHVEFTASVGDAAFLAIPGSHWQLSGDDMYALRIIDLRRAFTERAAAPGCSGQTKINVTDNVLPANSGTFDISWSNGRFVVDESSGAADISIDMRGLALLYCGIANPQFVATHTGGQYLPGGPADELAAALRSSAPVAQFYF